MIIVTDPNKTYTLEWMGKKCLELHVITEELKVSDYCMPIDGRGNITELYLLSCIIDDVGRHSIEKVAL